jgi:hypothetical protein
MTTYGKSSLKTLTVCNNWRWISSKWSIANLILSKWLIHPFTFRFIWILNDSNPKFPSKIWEWLELGNSQSITPSPWPSSIHVSCMFAAHLLINSLLILVEHLGITFLFVFPSHIKSMFIMRRQTCLRKQKRIRQKKKKKCCVEQVLHF